MNSSEQLTKAHDSYIRSINYSTVLKQMIGKEPAAILEPVIINDMIHQLNELGFTQLKQNIFRRDNIIFEIIFNTIHMDTFKKWKVPKVDYFYIISQSNKYKKQGYQYYYCLNNDIEHFINANYKTVEELAPYNSKKYTFYIAGGWFSEKQAGALSRLDDAIDKCGYTSYKPRKDGINISALKATRQLYTADFLDVYFENIKAISESEVIFASTCENDSGTVYEIAVAQSLGMPTFLFDDTLGNKNINIMLSMNADAVFTDINKVELFLKDFKYTPPELNYE